MAAEEPQVATKAPESDAQTPASTTSLFPNDTPAQSGPTMGEHCTTDRPLASADRASSVKGEVTSINSVQCYVSKPSEYPHSPGKLLLFLTGGTGIHSVNNQLQADKYAEKGYLVVMPDQFGGDAAPNAAATVTAASSQDDAIAPAASSSSPSLLERFKLGAAETAKSFFIDMWLARHTPAKVMPILLKALEGAREEFADAVANGGGIYGVGYCFGAKYIMLLCGNGADSASKNQGASGDEEKGQTTQGPEVKVGAVAHGTLITKDDMNGIKAPIYIAAVENDPLFPKDILESGLTSFKHNGVEHKFQLFDGVPHGYAIEGDYQDETIHQKQRETFDTMVDWLETH